MLDEIEKFCNIKCSRDHRSILFCSQNAILFLDNMYKNANELYRLDRKYNRYLQWKNKYNLK